MVDLSMFPKKSKLDGDREIVIRSLEKSDETELARFMRELPPEERVYFRDDVTNPAVIHGWIHVTSRDKVIPLIALENDKIIASWSLHLSDALWTRHLAHIRGVVDPDYRGFGLAPKMIFHLLTIANQFSIERVVVELVAEQKRLLAKITGLGFQLEAVLKDWAKDHNCKYHDLLILTMRLQPAWKKMEEMISDYGTHGG